MTEKEYKDLTELVRNTQDDTSKFFDALYAASYPYAYSAASKLLKKDEVEDTLQNTFIYVYNHIKDLQHPEAYLKWLNRITVNYCLKRLKNQSRHRKTIDAEKKRLQMKQSVNDEYYYIDNLDITETIHLLIDKLSPKKKEIIVLYFYDQMTYSEISEKLGIPIGTVMSRLHSAKKELEKKIKELQKNGTILWSLPVLPLVAAILSYNVKAHVSVASATQISVSAATVSAGTVSTSGAAVTATSAGTAGIGTATAGVGSSIAVKAAAVALATSVAVGGGAAAKAVIKNSKESATETAVSYPEESLPVAAVSTATTKIYIFEPANNDENHADKTTLTQTEQKTEPVTTAKQTAVIAGNSENRKQSSNMTSKHEKRTTRSKTTTAASSATQTSESTSRETTTEKPTEKASEKTTQPKQISDLLANTTEKQSETTANPYAGMSVLNGVLTGYSGDGNAVTIPTELNNQKISSIGASAFKGSGVSSVSISPGIAQIGQMAFSGCTSLSSISLPPTLTVIDDCAFDGCSSLKSIAIPDSVTSIGDDAFDGCDDLIIKCSEGSAAHEYAVENSIEYELI